MGERLPAPNPGAAERVLATTASPRALLGSEGERRPMGGGEGRAGACFPPPLPSSPWRDSPAAAARRERPPSSGPPRGSLPPIARHAETSGARSPNGPVMRAPSAQLTRQGRWRERAGHFSARLVTTGLGASPPRYAGAWRRGNEFQESFAASIGARGLDRSARSGHGSGSGCCQRHERNKDLALPLCPAQTFQSCTHRLEHRKTTHTYDPDRTHLARGRP